MMFSSKKSIMSILLTTFIAIVLLSTVSCSSSYSGKAEIGVNDTPAPGLPFISLAASSNVTENGTTQVLVYLSISENSLIFKRQQDSLVSRANVNIEILSKDNKAEVSRMYQLLFGKDPDTKYYDQNTIYLERVFAISPGEYTVRTSITDLHSGKQTTSEQNISVPDPKTGSVFISNIRFYEKTNPDEKFIAVNNYDVNAGFDSLKFVFQVTNGANAQALEVQSRLMRFEADTAPARSMSGKNHRKSSLEYKGLDYTKYETIQSTRRNLEASGSVTIENSFADLEKGNYRFEVSALTSEGERFFEVRDFSVKSENFPQIKTPRELALPLIYIMKEDEYNELLQIKSEDSLKSAIDAYWLRNIRNTLKAKRILQLYYERVEQANLQFSNYKEGWKTDRGMIYILFGPPLYKDSGFGEMTWFYEFDSGNRNPSIYFEDTRYGNVKFPFQNFVLQRSSALFNLQYRQIQSWNDGSILFLSQ